jgi:cellulose synthase operon protein C
MSMTAVFLAASFWPFTAGKDADVATVADAVPLVVEAGAPPPAADPVAAADAYAAFLSSPAAADPEMRLTALRRLADLRLETAELALMDGFSPQRDLDEAVGLYRALLEDPALHGAAPGMA